jgi:hypothetical protein
MKPEMVIEILTFEGCPSAQITRDLVASALRLEAAHATVREIEVGSVDVAQTAQFLGSPSVRIDGRDVEPGAHKRRDYGLMCRTYRQSDLSNNAPSLDMIRAAIRVRLDSRG